MLAGWLLGSRRRECFDFLLGPGLRQVRIYPLSFRVLASVDLSRMAWKKPSLERPNSENLQLKSEVVCELPSV